MGRNISKELDACAKVLRQNVEEDTLRRQHGKHEGRLSQSLSLSQGQNTRYLQLKGGEVCLACVLEVSALAWLSGFGRQQCGGRAQVGEATHILVSRKQRQKEGTEKGEVPRARLTDRKSGIEPHGPAFLRRPAYQHLRLSANLGRNHHQRGSWTGFWKGWDHWKRRPREVASMSFRIL